MPDAGQRHRIGLPALCASVSAALGLACYLRLVFQQPLSMRMNEVFGDSVRLLLVLFYYFVSITVSIAAFTARDRADRLFGQTVYMNVIPVAVALVGAVLVHPSLVGMPQHPVAAGVGITAYAVGIGLMACMWGTVLYRLDHSVALTAVMLSFPLFELLRVLQHSYFVPRQASALTLIYMLVMLACWFAVRCKDERFTPKCEVALLGELPLGDVVFLLLCVCSCAAATGILSLVEQDPSGIAEVVVTLALPALLCAVMLAPSRLSRSSEKVMPGIYVVGAIVVVVSLSVSVAFAEFQSNSRLPETLISLSRLYCTVCLMLIAVKGMHERAISPTMLFSAVNVFAFMVPNILGKFIIPEIDMHTNAMILRYETLFMLGLSALLVCMAFVNLSRRKVLVVEVDSGIEAKMKLVKAYDAVAGRFKLTEREREVMQLIAEGNSMKKVAELLFISLGTVQTHAKNIYRKLDVHSRQELVELVEEAKEGE